MLPDPNTPPITPPGIKRVGGEQQSLVLIEQADAGRGVARRVHHVEAEIAEVDQIAFLEPDIDIDRHVRLVEHLAQHREIVAQHDLVGGEPMRGDDGAAAEMIGGADMIEMFVAENHHVDLVGRTIDMVRGIPAAPDNSRTARRRS